MRKFALLYNLVRAKCIEGDLLVYLEGVRQAEAAQTVTLHDNDTGTNHRINNFLKLKEVSKLHRFNNSRVYGEAVIITWRKQ